MSESEERRSELDAWLQREGGRLLVYAERVLRDPERARDAVQEALLAYWRLPDPPPSEARLPWMLRCVRHRAIDRLRREQRRMDTIELGLQPETQAASAASPEAQAGAREAGESLLGAVQELPERQREVLHLKFHAELSYREIAEVTGLSTSHVGVLIHRAMQSLGVVPKGAAAQSGGPAA